MAYMKKGFMEYSVIYMRPAVVEACSGGGSNTG